MKKILAILTCLVCPIVYAERPSAFTEKLAAIDSLFNNVTHSKYRVEIMTISKDTPYDPPPKLEEYAEVSSVIFSISSHLCYNEIRSAINEFKSLSLNCPKHDGYPSEAWRIIDIYTNEVKIGVLIDRSSGLVCIEGQWFSISPGFTDVLIDQFITIADGLKPIRK